METFYERMPETTQVCESDDGNSQLDKSHATSDMQQVQVRRVGGIINCAGEIDIPDHVVVPSGEFVDRPA